MINSPTPAEDDDDAVAAAAAVRAAMPTIADYHIQMIIHYIIAMCGVTVE